MTTTQRTRCAQEIDKSAIADFLTATATTENFSFAARQLYIMQPQPMPPRLIAWYRQQPDAERTTVNALKFYADAFYTCTKNGHIADKRGENSLFSLDAIVIDCDAHGSELTESEYQYECNRLLFALDAAAKERGRIPAFSGVTYSGRGLHLWCMLESMSAKLLPLYKFFANAICNEVKAVCSDIDSVFDVDFTASCNASGLIRIGGTVNQSAGRTAIFERRCEKRYDLSELQELCAVNMDAAGKRFERKHGDRTKDEPERRAQYRPLNRKRMHFLEAIARTQPNQTGRRELLLFAFCNAAFCFFNDTEKAESAAIRFNSLFSEPLPAKTPRELLRGISKKAGYDFTLDSFFTLISANSTDVYLYSHLTSQREEIRTEKRNVKAERNKKIIELHRKGFSCRQIAAETACSFKTVSRVIQGCGKN